jgi:hypothetical protein
MASMLQRFRRLSPPGVAMAGVAPPVDPEVVRASELAPVFATLDAVQHEVDAILAAARVAADRRAWPRTTAPISASRMPWTQRSSIRVAPIVVASPRRPERAWAALTLLPSGDLSRLDRADVARHLAANAPDKPGLGA